ncbi:MAG: fumarylacetoacetate hydrolase family protein [Anaerolineae bacterium]|nr:fumarylacetoacetate hydrolase family protein [Anaerolineae bacterium]
MLQICRFFQPGAGPRLGVVFNEQVYDLTATGQAAFSSLTTWLSWVSQQGTARAAQHLAEVSAALTPLYAWANLQHPPAASRPHLLPPLDAQEVWAAGVTYRRSREAREEESNKIGVYDKVYSASRPELFLKATPHRVVGPHDFIRVRADAHWTVPEPELTVLVAPDLQVVGYTAGNDVSSRDIEGENPLYLPQAKIYSRSCALGPAITLAADLNAPVQISLTIERAGQVVFAGEVSTEQMKRSIDELVSYLGRENEFPNGVFLMTGTGLVPPDDYTLQSGDVVEIGIERVGRLVNPVQ